MQPQAAEVRLDLPGLFVGQDVAEYVEVFAAPQMRAYFDKNLRVVWSRWNAVYRPCFNGELLKNISACYDYLEGSGGVVSCGGEQHPLEYYVLASDMPGVFNLGGDLDLFASLIEKHDRTGLLNYGRACIDVLYRNYVAHHLPITTISLVQGECLGGGFEAALSSDIIIAERSANFGFPEILFNLFPGMGAYSFLDRRVGQKAAEQLIASGKIYSAEEMHRLGVVDVLVEDGEGEMEVTELINRRKRTRNGLAGMAAARRRVHRLDFAELMDVVEIWVDSALRLNPRDLKLMHRLVSRQNNLGDSQLIH